MSDRETPPEEQTDPTVSMTDFLKKFSHAGNLAAREAATRSMNHVLEMFEEKDGELHARTVNIKAGENTVEVPLLTLMMPPYVSLGTLSIKFQVSVDITDEGDCLLYPHSKLMEKAVECEVAMDFEALETPEGIELLRDFMNKRLSHELGTSSGGDTL